MVVAERVLDRGGVIQNAAIDRTRPPRTLGRCLCFLQTARLEAGPCERVHRCDVGAAARGLHGQAYCFLALQSALREQACERGGLRLRLAVDQTPIVAFGSFAPFGRALLRVSRSIGISIAMMWTLKPARLSIGGPPVPRRFRYWIRSKVAPRST